MATFGRKIRRCIDKGEKYIENNKELLTKRGFKANEFKEVCAIHYSLVRLHRERSYETDLILRGALKKTIKKLTKVYKNDTLKRGD